MLGTQFGGNLIPTISRPPGLGRVYYVKLGGSDDNNGVDPNTPFLTIEHAIGECEDDHNDYIYVLDCWNADSYPITINKSRIHLIGVTVPSMNLFPQLHGGAFDVFRLNANYVEIAGFGFLTDGAKAGIITGAATPSYGWIHHCTFATAALSLLNGIESAPTGASQMGNMLIEDNFFGSNITGDGITGQLVNCIIRNNVFRDCGHDGEGVGINLGGVEIGAIYRNLFFRAKVGAAGHGWAIRLAALANGGIIAENCAAVCDTHTAWRPYQDLSAGGVGGAALNGWCKNWWGDNDAPTAPHPGS